MKNPFAEVMSKRTDDELLKVLSSNQGDYQPKAVIAAAEEAKRRIISFNYEGILNEKNTETEKEQKDTEFQDEVLSEYNKNNKKYGKLRNIATFYSILAWIDLIVGIFILLGINVIKEETMIGTSNIIILIALFIGSFVAFLTISELIKLFIDIEHNTRGQIH